jgi:hypothetical protein
LDRRQFTGADRCYGSNRKRIVSTHTFEVSTQRTGRSRSSTTQDRDGQRVLTAAVSRQPRCES